MESIRKVVELATLKFYFVEIICSFFTVFLSLPCVINSNGVTSIVKQKLSPDEVAKLQASANLMDEVQRGITF